MMSILELNVIYAVAIGSVISLMAYVKNSHLKAMVYSLPVSISITLIATGGNVNITNIIGLFLLTIFLWLVCKLSEKGINIYIADAVAVLSYIAIGYVSIKYIKIPFYLAILLYAMVWAAFIILYQPRPALKQPQQHPKINAQVKGLAVTVFAYLLLSLKTYLSGIIVTFPFGGVFAVIEGKYILETIASVFSRNSIAILAMFTTVYSLSELNLFIKIIAGWIAYLIVLKIVTRFIPLKNSRRQSGRL